MIPDAWPTTVRALFCAVCALAVLAASDAQARSSKPATPGGGSDSAPNLLGKSGDWEIYSGTNGGKKVCFALSRPTSSQTNPANRPRDPAFVFISSRPTDNVRNELSVVIGYTFKTSSDASADVGGKKFALMTQGDGAWLKNATEEARLIGEMRDGADLVIKGTSGRGTQTTDKYSLKGLSAALDRVAKECR